MNEYRLTANGDAERFSARILRFEGRVYVNPTREILRRAGYKPLRADPLPSDAGKKDWEGNPIVYEPVYTDEGDAIRLSYRRGVCPDDED